MTIQKANGAGMAPDAVKPLSGSQHICGQALATLGNRHTQAALYAIGEIEKSPLAQYAKEIIMFGSCPGARHGMTATLTFCSSWVKMRTRKSCTRKSSGLGAMSSRQMQICPRST